MEYRTYLDTPIGRMKIEGVDGAITVVDFDETGQYKSEEVPVWLEEGKRQLEAYFNGSLTAFSCRMEPQGTPFQHIVWKALMSVSFGTCVTYMDIARQIGRPRSIRAVANAIGRNPMLILVPCHRIIGSNGALTGFSAGLERKIWLLRYENHQLEEPKVRTQELRKPKVNKI